MTRNPAERLGKTRRCAGIRVGAPILGNTIGNLAANAIAGGGRSGTTGAGDAKADQPTTGEGGGQVGDIVVTARRSSTFGYVDYFPEATAALMSYDARTGGAGYAAARQQQRVATSLAQQIVSATAPSSPLGTGAAERKFTYVGGPNNGDVSDGSFNDNPYFYNRDTQTIDYYELASGSTQAVLRTDPVRTQMLNDGLSELNWGIGGFLGLSAGGGLVAATAPAWLAFAGYQGSAGTIAQAVGLKAGIGLSIELGGNYATGSDTTIGGLAGTTLASALIAPSATRIYGFGAKGLTIAGGASGFGGNLTGQFIDYFSTGRALNRTDLLLSTGFGALGGRFAAPLQDRFGATSLLFQKWSPYVDELYNAPATITGGATDITRKVILNNASGR